MFPTLFQSNSPRLRETQQSEKNFVFSASLLQTLLLETTTLHPSRGFWGLEEHQSVSQLEAEAFLREDFLHKTDCTLSLPGQTKV